MMSYKTLKRAWSLSLIDTMNVAQLWFYRAKGAVYYRFFFKSFGKNSAIFTPMLIANPRFISIGNGVTIRKGVRLEAVLVDPTHPPEIVIEDNVIIEQDVHISGVGRIYIRANAGIGARAAIIGASHPFMDVSDHPPVRMRVGGSKSTTEIGEGCLLGLGCVIQMNVKLGRHVIVGANSVVKKSVPSYCVVEGHPAVVILKYDAAEDRWITPSL